MKASITKRQLEMIARGEELFALIDVVADDQCDAYAVALMKDHMLTGYGTLADDGEESKSAGYIRRGGLTCYETCASPEKRDLYFRWARQAEPHFRGLFAPNASPMDLLRDELSNIWRQQVEAEVWQSQPMASQVSRVVPAGEEILPHTDVLWVDQAGELLVEPLMVSQLAINIYLAMPPQGGALQLWGLSPCRPAYKALQMHDSYGLDSARLGPPLVEIRPSRGQAIIFNSTMIHAVTPSIGGPRCTLSCFLGYRGPSQPLTVWA